MVGVGVAIMPGDWTETGVEGISSATVAGWLRRTLVNLRLAGRYSQARLKDSHLLHWGRSPEHFVFCEWHWLQARCALLRRVPASVRLCDGFILEILSLGGAKARSAHRRCSLHSLILIHLERN